MDACLFCGEPELVEIFEFYGNGEFQLETCCGDMHEATIEYLNEVEPDEAAAWLSTLGHGGFADEKGRAIPILPAMHHRGLRRVIADEGQFLLDWNLTLADAPWREVRTFIADHHRHNRPPAGWKFGTAVKNGGQTIAVASVGRPVSKAFDHTKVLEVNRVCVREDVPQAFVWNACSKLYGWAAKEGRRRGFEKIITYTREDELGTSLIAAGWEIDGKVRGASWSRPSRPRVDHGENVNKIRWKKDLIRSKGANRVTKQRTQLDSQDRCAA
jgi:hypothetical protein